MKKLLSSMLVLAMVAACSLAFVSCGEGTKDTNDTSAVNTDSNTKAETKAQTKAQTEAQTEVQTEAQTLPETTPDGLPVVLFTKECYVTEYVDFDTEITLDPDDHYDGETPDNLFDDDTFTKLCTDFDKEAGLSVTFRLKYAAKVSAINFITGGDTSAFPERNPTHFKLYGSQDNGASWTLIHESDLELPEEDEAMLEEDMKISCDAAYQNFKIEFTALSYDGGILQLSELRLFGMLQAAE